MTGILKEKTTFKELKMNRSNMLMDRAKKSIAGGDSSTMRALPYAIPLIAESGKGSRLWDVDDNEYIDLNMAYGPLLFGHRPDFVIENVVDQIRSRGSQLGFQSEVGIRVAEKLKQLYPSMELMRFANSGTEAVASAIRLARTATKRNKLIMFEGHYHGWSEAIFNRYHAELDEIGYQDYGNAIPGTSGMNGGPSNVIVARYNRLDLLQQCMEEHGEEVAGIILEPMMGNAGVIPPKDGFLEGIRNLATQYGSLLIFDEVITGFRLNAGGAQAHYQVKPDITVLSKILGGGFPVSCFGASHKLMDVIIRGEMFHGGVFSANATVMSAVEGVLDKILNEKDQIYPYLYEISNALAIGLREILTGLEIPHIISNVGPVLSMFLTDGKIDSITEYRDVKRHCQFEQYIKLQHQLQKMGVYFHPNQFEPMFPSTTHTMNDIKQVLELIKVGASCLVPQ